MAQAIRWKQRFENFSDAFKHLKYAVEEVKNPNDLEKEGTIQRFESTHELAWKVMKDFLKDKGIQGIIGSKDATRLAFQNDIISNGQTWMDMIESRNKFKFVKYPEIEN
ncbi:MAG: nucleotidyltransferase [Bacteroidetes bacterium]|jgi:nucleotidyltransferase substrate binding protein (TIGR01987 family)|nr:nucleotidyltransferase [Bacteroidota bacterium]